MTGFEVKKYVFDCWCRHNILYNVYFCNFYERSDGKLSRQSGRCWYAVPALTILLQALHWSNDDDDDDVVNKEIIKVRPIDVICSCRGSAGISDVIGWRVGGCGSGLRGRGGHVTRNWRGRGSRRRRRTQTVHLSNCNAHNSRAQSYKSL